MKPLNQTELIELAKQAGAKVFYKDGELHIVVADGGSSGSATLFCTKFAQLLAEQQQGEAVAYLRFFSRSWLVNTEIGMDGIQGYEVCKKGETGDDGSPAFPVFTAPQTEQSIRNKALEDAADTKLTAPEITMCHSKAILAQKHDGADPSFTTLLAAQFNKAYQAKIRALKETSCAD